MSTPFAVTVTILLSSSPDFSTLIDDPNPSARANGMLRSILMGTVEPPSTTSELYIKAAIAKKRNRIGTNEFGC